MINWEETIQRMVADIACIRRGGWRPIGKSGWVDSQGQGAVRYVLGKYEDRGTQMVAGGEDVWLRIEETGVEGWQGAELFSGDELALLTVT